MIVTVCSVRVSDFTIAIEMPKPTAAASAINWPGLISPVAGRTIMTTPTMPSTMAVNFQIVMRSPRNIAARIAVQIGMVNSIATTWPIGISVSAKNQPSCAPKWMVLRASAAAGAASSRRPRPPAR